MFPILISEHTKFIGNKVGLPYLRVKLVNSDPHPSRPRIAPVPE